MSSLRRSTSPPRKPPTYGFEVLDNDYLLEEETFSWYDPEAFYPVRIGDISVKVPSTWKVGLWFGIHGLALSGLNKEIFSEHRYITLKVFVSNHRQALNEGKVYNHLRSIKTDHPGVKGVRTLSETFQLPGKYGPHECLVHDPLALTLADIRQMSEGEKVSEELLKPVIKYLLMALDFLHTEAGVVHTDIQEGNIMIGIEDDTILKDFEQEERAEASLQKIDGDRIIYATRQVDIPDNPSQAVLCDFGDAQFGVETCIGEVMPDLYRAPEIILGIPWNEKIDIWSVGLMVWDSFEGKHMFTERLPNRNASAPAHLARIISLLGPPPKYLVERGQFSESFFHESGELKDNAQVQQSSLEDEEENLEGEEKSLFLEFLRKMLQ